MKLPPKKRPGNPILARDWNELLDAILARTPRPGPGTELVSSSGGFSFRVRASTAAGRSKPIPLAILGSQPSYIASPEPSDDTPPDPESTSKTYFIEWGTLNNLVASNWDDSFDVSTTTYFFAKATLPTTDSLVVSSWEIVTGPDSDSHQTPTWAIGSERPSSAVILLGSVLVKDGKHTVVQSGGGSIVLSEHITSILPGSSAGEIKIGKDITFHRLTY